MLPIAQAHYGRCSHVLHLTGMCAQVLIFDFDVHHGNGTNDVFYEDPSVLFISTHQAGIYPGTGGLGEVGKGDGEGASINLPLPGVHQLTVTKEKGVEWRGGKLFSCPLISSPEKERR